jgi:hypothetical protein
MKKHKSIQLETEFIKFKYEIFVGIFLMFFHIFWYIFSIFFTSANSQIVMKE